MANVPRRICVVGAGTRFLSGISYYTLRLTNALAGTHRVSAVLMRQLLPTRLYPGRRRVGAELTSLRYDPGVRVFNGVDWYWLPSLARALWFLARERPEVIHFQWWSGTVIHSYLALAMVGRLLGAKVVIEFHEALDTGEAGIPLAQAYVGTIAPLLLGLADGFVVHSEFDRAALEQRYGFRGRPVAVIPHGPYDHHRAREGEPTTSDEAVCHLLYFGVIRPFKGLEDLILAFDAIPPDRIKGYRLTVVGETWEGWTLPGKLIAESRYRDRITFVNRYVQDEEVTRYYAAADAIVLPYHRSSASGPLHIAMSHGLPVVVTTVGGLTEAVAGYEGAVLIPPRDQAALEAALVRVAQLRGARFADPHSWARNADRYASLFDRLVAESRPLGAAA
jgi:glycosyltransferase involved in cell wall biosynthesis